MEDPTSAISPQDDFVKVVNEMTASITAGHNVVRSLLEKHRADPETLEVKEGISLLTMKNHVLMSYLQSLVLLSTHRILGHSLIDRDPPKESFASTSREARGSGAGDLVDSLVEGRAILEKAKTMETKMRYQIDKLVRMAKEAPNGATQDVLADPLAFRPNPDNLLETGRSRNDEDAVDGRRRDRNDDEPSREGVYRPPQIAPVPYDEDRKGKKRRDAPLPAALASLANYNPSNPYIESTSGLGNDASVVTNRQRELKSMTRFEEEHMTRMVMSKSEMRRRERDEQDIAFGGTGNTGKFGHAGDFEGEFSDILKSIDRSQSSKVGDGYDTLREKGKKGSVLERSRGRMRPMADLDFGDDGEDTRWKKKAKLERGGRGGGRGGRR